MRSISSNCKHCGKSIVRTTCHEMRYKSFFCSKECKDSDNVKFGPEALKYVQENINKVARSEMIAKLNTTPYGLQRAVSKWRSAGVPLPHFTAERANPVNTAAKYSQPRIVRKKVVVEVEKVKKPKIVKPVKKEPVVVFKTKTIDLSNSVYEKRDNRTWVLKKKDLVASSG